MKNIFGSNKTTDEFVKEESIQAKINRLKLDRYNLDKELQEIQEDKRIEKLENEIIILKEKHKKINRKYLIINTVIIVVPILVVIGVYAWKSYSYPKEIEKMQEQRLSNLKEECNELEEQIAKYDELN